MYHLLVFFVTYLTYGLVELPPLFHQTFGGLAIVSFGWWAWEALHQEKKGLLAVERDLSSKKKEDCVSLQGAYVDRTAKGFIPDLPDYCLLTFETDQGRLELLCRDRFLIEWVSKQTGKVGLRHYDRFLMGVDDCR